MKDSQWLCGLFFQICGLDQKQGTKEQTVYLLACYLSLVDVVGFILMPQVRFQATLPRGRMELGTEVTPSEKYCRERASGLP